MTEEEKEMLKSLKEKEEKSNFEYEDPDVSNVEIPGWIPDEVKREKPEETNLGNVNSQGPTKTNLGKVEINKPMGMENGWKNLPLDVLPSRGFGYPDGFEIAIRSAEVSEIRHYSTIDESDRIDLDDKLNYILDKCMKIKWAEGPLDTLDLWYEDRFFVIMCIRDMTFVKGENNIILPLEKNCTGDECNLPDTIELKSVFLDSFHLESDLTRRYNKEKYCFEFIPKDGSPKLDLYIPTLGVTCKARKIIKEKKRLGKKYDESFIDVASFVIPDWRNLNERVYDQYERLSNDWTNLQFSIADQMSKKINFSTKSRIFTKCESCGGEATAEIRFPGGYRSLFVISDLSGKLL